jgi:carboxymethylenebutenolidase
MRKLFVGIGLGIAITGVAGAQDWAKTRIEKSPRHLEWVKVKNGSREVSCYLAYPEIKDKATAVLVIHEIFGLSDWAKSMCDQLAEAGYIAIAPDLLSGVGPNGGGTAELGSRDAVTRAVGSLPADQVSGDLDAAATYVTKLPSCNGKLVVCGFCWGGAKSFRYAAHNKEVKASFVFYGAGPKEDEIKSINCPVYGFYGGYDNRVTSTVEESTKVMKSAGKTYEPVTYEDAGHGFMRLGEDPGDKNPANKKARDEAWTRWKALLKKI